MADYREHDPEEKYHKWLKKQKKKELEIAKLQTKIDKEKQKTKNK